MKSVFKYDTLSMTKEEFFNRYKNRQDKSAQSVLLESGRGGTYSIAGIRPFAILKGEENRLHIITEDGTEERVGDPLVEMQVWMKRYETDVVGDLPDFQGGVIGFISYDYARNIEELPTSSSADVDVPYLYFLAFKDWVVYDHSEELLYVMSLTDENSLCWQEEVERWRVPYHSEVEYGKSTSTPITPSFTEEQFGEAVRKIQEYISAGDVFQVNLSVRQDQELHAKPISVYEELRKFNPSPYMAYMETEEFQIVSGSPELLIKKSGNKVSTRPIAGTRSRGRSEEEDQKLADELIHNEKERAEHVMLVDLERNDLGRVCRYGTVEVNEFMVIEKYSHVMHIVSNVQGELAEEHTEADLIRAVFPGGTITGAPKVRTMEIIEELEPVRRGLYTGSIGWIGFNHDIELNIVIRTMLVKDGKAYIQAGAGVVIDSNPKYEYKESLKKAQALWKAKQLAEGADITP
ncbi:aminobenzoate synthetase [Bacillus coahuilensis m2-6]|uniref:anthranilate synthase component I family protein n=1 Tax=Bacillus coahuilensis TaxID=408580 RepID=UPI0007502550|nr:anthranilate synthase component I family protein [Bacillus coahuilensis]KUP04245.1 aminobenzoate synthetase [Bacillus coahuilensis m2-6]